MMAAPIVIVALDALVSNTNIARCAGSTPALGTKKQLLRLLFLLCAEKFDVLKC